MSQELGRGTDTASGACSDLPDAGIAGGSSHTATAGMAIALHERAALDPRSGRVMNANLAEYHVPVNADVPPLEAILVEEADPHVNALGIKGVGEIGITGTAGAIANAVWHATGVRVRRFPITVEQLIGAGAV